MSPTPATPNLPKERAWPALPLAEWAATRDTLHMWTQLVGKLRLALSPRVNHWWEVPLYVSPRGLTTSAIPYPRGVFEVEFDFLAHVLRFTTSAAETTNIVLAPRSVADFSVEFLATLASLGINAKIWHMPVEVVTRFSGRRAPARPNADRMTREAYSHECSSAGWWPGGGDVTAPMFYAYAAPEPAGFRDSTVRARESFLSHTAWRIPTAL